MAVTNTLVDQDGGNDRHYMKMQDNRLLEDLACVNMWGILYAVTHILSLLYVKTSQTWVRGLPTKSVCGPIMRSCTCGIPSQEVPCLQYKQLRVLPSVTNTVLNVSACPGTSAPWPACRSPGVCLALPGGVMSEGHV